MSVRVGAGQGLVAPVDGVGPAVQAVVVRGWGAGGGLRQRGVSNPLW